MKKITALVLALAMIGPINAMADDDIEIVLNGTEMTFEQTPFIDDGTTLVPMRAIFEALDSTVEWDGETRSITSVKGDITITMQIDSFEMSVNDTKLTLEKAPIIVDDFTFVPLRAVAESFNAEVNWDGEKRLITIDTPPEATEAPTTEPTEAPTEAPAEEPTPTPFPTTDEEFAKMYEGTEYEFVRNISELTTDFAKGASGFDEKYYYGWGTDNNDNGVLYVQKETRTRAINTTTEKTLSSYNPYVRGEMIHIAFDMYCPSSNGNSRFSVVGMGDQNIFSITVKTSGKECNVIENEEIDANTYFNNNTEGTSEDIVIENSAHIEMLIKPDVSKIFVRIKNNGNDAEEITYQDFISGAVLGSNSLGFANLKNSSKDRVRLRGFEMEAQYAANAKPMFVDNIITNIVKEAGTETEESTEITEDAE